MSKKSENLVKKLDERQAMLMNLQLLINYAGGEDFKDNGWQNHIIKDSWKTRFRFLLIYFMVRMAANELNRLDTLITGTLVQLSEIFVRDIEIRRFNLYDNVLIFSKKQYADYRKLIRHQMTTTKFSIKEVVHDRIRSYINIDSDTINEIGIQEFSTDYEDEYKSLLQQLLAEINNGIFKLSIEQRNESVTGTENLLNGKCTIFENDFFDKKIITAGACIRAGDDILPLIFEANALEEMGININSFAKICVLMNPESRDIDENGYSKIPTVSDIAEEVLDRNSLFPAENQNKPANDQTLKLWEALKENIHFYAKQCLFFDKLLERYALDCQPLFGNIRQQAKEFLKIFGQLAQSRPLITSEFFPDYEKVCNLDQFISDNQEELFNELCESKSSPWNILSRELAPKRTNNGKPNAI
jgi:hypothetical protein